MDRGAWWATVHGPQEFLMYRESLRLEEGSGGPSKDRSPKLVHAKWIQLCPTLCGPMDCSPPGSSVHGLLQAGVLG